MTHKRFHFIKSLKERSNSGKAQQQQQQQPAIASSAPKNKDPDASTSLATCLSSSPADVSCYDFTHCSPEKIPLPDSVKLAQVSENPLQVQEAISEFKIRTEIPEYLLQPPAFVQQEIARIRQQIAEKMDHKVQEVSAEHVPLPNSPPEDQTEITEITTIMSPELLKHHKEIETEDEEESLGPDSKHSSCSSIKMMEQKTSRHSDQKIDEKETSAEDNTREEGLVKVEAY